MKKRVENTTTSSSSNINKSITTAIIILLLLGSLMVLFDGIVGYTGYATYGNSNDSGKIFATKITDALGTKCYHEEKADLFYVGINTKKNYSSAAYFNLNNMSSGTIESAQVCYAKDNSNSNEFEISIYKEDKLNCPNAFADINKIATRDIKNFKTGNYYCLDITEYIKTKAASGEKDIYLSIRAKKISKAATYMTFYGLTKNNKHTPYIEIKSKGCTPSCTGGRTCGDDLCGGSCGTCALGKTCNTEGSCIDGCQTNWICSDWGECINGKQTRSCNASNNCGTYDVNTDITKDMAKDCIDPNLCSNSGIGFYDFFTNTFYLKNSLNAGVPDNIFKFGARPTDPNNSYYFGYLYSPGESYYYSGGTTHIIPLGLLIPVTGDWDGDGKDSVGLFERDTGKFYLKNSNTPGEADIVFTFNNPDIIRDKDIVDDGKTIYVQGRQVTLRGGRIHLYPYAGDWDGDGKDSVAIYDDITKKAYYKNSNTDGDADSIEEGDSYNHRLFPYAGDFNGDGSDELFIHDNEYSVIGDSADRFCFTDTNAYSAYKGQVRCRRNYYYVDSVAGDWDNDGRDEPGYFNLEANSNGKGESTFFLKMNFETDLVPSKEIIKSFLFGGEIGADLKALYVSKYDGWSGQEIDYTYIDVKNSFKFAVTGNWNGCKRVNTCSCGNKDCGDDGCGRECIISGTCRDLYQKGGYQTYGYKCVNNRCITLEEYACTKDSDCGNQLCISPGGKDTSIMPKCESGKCKIVKQNCTDQNANGKCKPGFGCIDSSVSCKSDSSCTNIACKKVSDCPMVNTYTFSNTCQNFGNVFSSVLAYTQTCKNKKCVYTDNYRTEPIFCPSSTCMDGKCV